LGWDIKMTKGEDIFIRITNKDIWEEIQALRKKIDKIHDLAIETNGKVKLHQKFLFSAGPIIIAIIGWLLLITLKI